MIKINLTDENNKDITSCECGLSSHEERITYLALRKALLNYKKLIVIFGDEQL